MLKQGDGRAQRSVTVSGIQGELRADVLKFLSRLLGMILENHTHDTCYYYL